MSNMGRLKLHPIFDERIFFTIFPIRLNGGTSQFNSPTQSNVNASLPPSASGQILFSDAFPRQTCLLSLCPTPNGQFIKYVWCYKPFTKDYDFTKFDGQFSLNILWKSNKY